MSWTNLASITSTQLPPCFTVGMVPGFLQTWCMAFRSKSSNLVSSDQRILFLMVWESLGAFWQTPSELSCAFYCRVASVWPLYHNGLISGVLQRWLSCWKLLPSPQRNSGSLSEWPSFLVHLPDQGPSPPISQFGLAASSWKSLGGSKLLPFKNDGHHCLIALQTIPLTSLAWFLLWHALSAVGPFI